MSASTGIGDADRIEQVLIRLDPRLPVQDVTAIGERLARSGALVPGWIPPAVGAFDIRALLFAEHVDGLTTILLPDRNVVSRMARIAREGLLGKRDHPMDVAVLLMAFAQAMHLQIEPGLAFHELAQCSGNAEACDELRWFRTADRGGSAQTWIDLALGRTTEVDLGRPAAEERVDLRKPLTRWRRNYVVALKIAELELSGGSPIDRLLRLLDWMMADFILAGPALMFAARYWAPGAPRAGLIKQLRSPDRERAVCGARNAAWDISYLSEFVRRVGEGQEDGRQCVLATADRHLAEIARVPLLGLEPDGDWPSLEQALSSWWSADHASRFCRSFFKAHALVVAGRGVWSDARIDPIPLLIEAGEERLRALGGL